MNACFIVPVYNHGVTLVPLARRLAEFKIPVIVVDDGSGNDTKNYIDKARNECAFITLITLKKNSGKGAAVSAGLSKADEIGLTHALQIDADAQHDTESVQLFFDEAEKHPASLICGAPRFDASVPAPRLKGREISNIWARIVTLNPGIVDVLCGFRVYPVGESVKVIKRYHLDKRMGFDADILARLYLSGTPLLFLPVNVTYPPGGISHFRLVRDNIRISIVFAKLFFYMIFHIRHLIKLRKRNRCA